MAFAFASYTFYDAYESGRILVPEPPPTQNEIAIAARWVEIWFWIKLSFLLLAIFAIYAAVMRFLLVPAFNSWGEFNIADNGLWKPKSIITSSLKERMNPFIENKFAVIDPNEQALPVIEVRSNGHLDVQGSSGGISEQNQIGLAHNVARSHSFSAMSGGGKQRGRGMTQAEAKLSAGVYDAQRQREEARTRAIDERKNASVALLPEAAIVTPNPEITLLAALSRSTPGVIEIGQSENEKRDIATVDFNIEPFVMVAGKTRVGKTTTVAFHLVLACIGWGWPVTVFEPPEKRDWRNSFGNHISHHTVTADNAQAHMDMIIAEYKRRSQVMADRNIVNWQDDPRSCPPWVIVLEELGALRESFALDEDTRAGKERLARFDSAMKMLVKRAANTGLIMIAVEQYPNKYDPAVRGGFSKVAFYVGGMGLGNVVESSKNHLLRGARGVFDRGEQDINGDPIFYKAFHAEAQLATILPSMPMIKAPALLAHNDCFNVEKPRTRPEPSEATNSAVNPPLPVVGSSGSVGSTKNNEGGKAGGLSIPPSLRRGFERTRRWDDFCQGFFNFYPEATQAQLKRAMADVDGQGREYTAFNGEGRRQWHRWSPVGDRRLSEEER